MDTDEPEIDLALEVSLTSEMTKAGAEVVRKYNSAVTTPEAHAEAVYRAMHLKRRPPFEIV